MQTMKSFVQGVNSDGTINIEPIYSQINTYLEQNPTHIAKSISVVDHNPSVEAFVLFDIREERKPQEHSENKKFRKDGPENGK